RYAQALAALCTASSSMALVMASFYSMNAFELPFWLGLVLALTVAAKGEGRRGWLVWGALVGVALANKPTAILIVTALMFGFVVTPLRTELRARSPWLGLSLAALLLLPNVIWQSTHGWPSLEFYRNAQTSKNVATSVLGGITNQILVAGPGT